MTSPAQPARGRLDDGSGAPRRGERHRLLAAPGDARVEEILTGALEGPQAFPGADDDEWVVVLGGSARLEVAGEVHALGPGDWVLIPAGTPHVLHEAAPGTVWLAVHAPAS